ncbi:MAG: NAD(P)/FAD-dependent oxidoreductase [Nitrospira sp.]|nr:NAD(P)/FAD-dependent oxidoreductase [Nitrospira sp.]
MKDYDVIIVGAGPAGIFAALEIVASGRGLKVLMIERGKDIDHRLCPSVVTDTACRSCSECGLVCGWGGAGAFSDGKLTLSQKVGGNLSRYVDTETLDGLIKYTDDIYMKYGAPDEVHGTDAASVAVIEEMARQNGLTLVPSLIRHIGTDQCPIVLKNMKAALNGSVDIKFLSGVKKILNENGAVAGIESEDGQKINAEYVIVAPGREGALWLERQSKLMGLTLLNNPVDIGVRVELPATTLEPLTRVMYEPKLVYHSKKFNDKIRTFCVNPYGEVVKEYVKGVWIVNGHSYSNKKTKNTNFALLVSTHFTEPFNEPHLYGRYIARLANLLGRGVILQRLGDLQAGQRSTPSRIAKGKVRPSLKDAVPGDLSFALPHRYIANLLEMLKVMDKLAPGVNSQHTLLYGIEVKFYSRQLKLDNNLETEMKNLFAIGDGAGVSRGLIQASASGVMAANAILSRK